MNSYLLITLALIFIALVSGSFWYLLKQHDIVEAEFEMCKQEILNAKTKQEFNLAVENAKRWQRLCFHKSHIALIIQLNLIIEIKKEILND